MARYSVDIQANLIGFEKLDSAEQQIKQLQALAKSGIDFNLKIGGLTDLKRDIKNITHDINSQFASVEKQINTQMTRIGKQKYNIASPTIKGFSSKGFLKEEKAMRTMANRFYSENKEAIEKLEKSGFNKTAMQATRTRVNNAKALLNEQLALIDKFQRKKSEYVKHNNNGNIAQALVAKDELGQIQNRMRSIRNLAKDYNDVYSKLKIKPKKQIKNKVFESSNIVSSANASIIDKAQRNAEKEYLKKKNQLKAIRNKESSSYSNAYTDAYQSIGKKSNVLKDMASYYSELEKSSKVEYKKYKKQQESMLKDGFVELRQNAFQSIGKKSPELKAMSDYYSNLEKEAQKQQVTINKIREMSNSGLFEYRSSKNNLFLEKYSGQNSTALSNARNQIAEIEQLQSKLKSGNLSGADTISTYERLETILGKLSYSMKQVGVETSKTLDPRIADTSANKVKAYYEANTRAVSKYGEELKEIEERYRRVKTVEDKLNVDRDYKNLQSKISSEGLTGKSALHEFKRAFKSIAEFTGIYGALQNVMYEVPRQMINAVMDVNKAQIELMKVSDASELELSRYWDEAAESANKYGATISDVIKSTADWSRLGYNLDDAKKLSDVTTLLTKVGDNMTQESASQGLISTLKGFDLTADKAQSIVDKINEVANTEPIDTAGLFAGLERSASSLSTANNSLEQSIALITAGNTIVQDPNKVGTGFKTISMRIRGAKTDLEEAGLETEGMAKSTAKLRDELISLSGVDIMLDDKTFKSTYDIMDELSKKWKEINDIDKANIIELIAGKRQGNLVSGLLNNFDIARETLDTALNKSSGSALQELENWNKGTEASISRFKSQLQALSTVTINSDVFKGFVDGGTKALEILTKIIDVGNGLPAIASIYSGFMSYKGMGKHNIVVINALSYKIV